MTSHATLRSSLADLVAYCHLRARLPRQFAAQPIDSLLRSLAPASTPVTSRSLADALRITRVGTRVMRWWPQTPNTCLFRALALFAFLRERGFPVCFVMGVHPCEQRDGHAWVELNARALEDPPERELVVTYRYPKQRFTGENGAVESAPADTLGFA